MIFSLDAIAGQLILPSPKPSVDQETKKKVAEGKEIYPEKKPLKKK
tara:strand:+ start:564 stop:701 length:138 start_codon:yes stop_codon:yes gene_type:complete